MLYALVVLMTALAGLQTGLFVYTGTPFAAGSAVFTALLAIYAIVKAGSSD